MAGDEALAVGALEGLADVPQRAPDLHRAMRLAHADSRLMHCSKAKRSEAKRSEAVYHTRPASLLDDLVSNGEQIGRHSEAEGLGGFQVDDQLELARLEHRQVGWLLPSRIRPA